MIRPSTGKRIAIAAGVTALLASLLPLIFWRRVWERYMAYCFDQIGVLIRDYHAFRGEGTGPGEDQLRVLGRNGEALWTQMGLTSLGSDEPLAGLAIDEKRFRIYVQDWKSGKILVLDPRGKLLFTLDHSCAVAIAIDSESGAVWCVRSNWPHPGTTVFEAEGAKVRSHPWGGADIAQNRFDDSFWIVGQEIRKVDRYGGELARGLPPVNYCQSIAPNHRDGSVWVAENSGNGTQGRLLHLNTRGGLLCDIPFPKGVPFHVVCDPESGTAWVASTGGRVESFTHEGKPLHTIPFEAEDVSLSARTQTLWLSTRSEIISMDQSRTVLMKCESKNKRHWIVAP